MLLSEIEGKENWKTPNSYDKDFEDPPVACGIYVIVLPDFKTLDREILYVGCSRNLKQRYEKHNTLSILREVYGYVQFYFIETDNYIEDEIDLITQARPKFNKQYC